MSESTYKQKVLKQYRKDGWFDIGLIQTNKNGIPDTLMMKKGEQPFFIEFKAVGKSAEPLQKYRHDEILKKTGCITIVLVEPGRIL